MGAEWSKDPRGEMCVLHRTVLAHGNGEWVVVGCDDRCPQYSQQRLMEIGKRWRTRN
jgi:hypothetical protein